MDPSRFDTVVRSLSQRSRSASSRRIFLGALGGLLTGALAGVPEAEAKKRRPRVRNRARRREKKGKNVTACPTGQLLCNGACAGCCEEADCGGNACRDGRCANCPSGQRECRGGCIAATACCSDGDCTGGQSCIGGTCGCRVNERLCEGACIPADACCGTDCPPPATCSAADCTGCCDGSVCKEGDSQNACGRDGEACLRCGQRALCDAGQCICPEGLVQCANGDCIRCEPRETCQGGSCVCPTECCADADCTEGVGGLCRPNGTCVYVPDCFPTGTPLGVCNPETTNLCCYACSTLTSECVRGPEGWPCTNGGDCMTGICSFYVCA